jgi:hypothetical protein
MRKSIVKAIKSSVSSPPTAQEKSRQQCPYLDHLFCNVEFGERNSCDHQFGKRIHRVAF